VGICFPNQKIANKCPHLTLLSNEWSPTDSNTVLEKTCLGDKAPFSDVYRQLKENGTIEEGNWIKEGKVKIHANEN
jgi:hypothetical protein